MSNALTYLDDDSGAAFEPHESRHLIFEAWLNHGPGHDEKDILAASALSDVVQARMSNTSYEILTDSS